MGEFLDALEREQISDRIGEVLHLDYERIAGPALRRLSELLPQDSDLSIALAYWNYHFGYDDEAHTYLQLAKASRPFDPAVLKTEIYFNYHQPADELMALVNQAIKFLPSDEWLAAIAKNIKIQGSVGGMIGPTIPSKWNTLMFASRRQ